MKLWKQGNEKTEVFENDDDAFEKDLEIAPPTMMSAAQEKATMIALIN